MKTEKSKSVKGKRSDFSQPASGHHDSTRRATGEEAKENGKDVSKAKESNGKSQPPNDAKSGKQLGSKRKGNYKGKQD